MAEKRIGILTGCEWSWPPAFLTEVNRRQAGVSAELVKVGGTRLAEPALYNVIVDRISHEIPYYHSFLKTAVLTGTRVINSPFNSHDRFYNASLIVHKGFRHPRMVALPSHSYPEGINDDSLRNLVYPIPWEQHITYLGGFPLVLRPIRDTHLQRIYILENYDDLWQAYNKTGHEPMMLREHITWDKYVRCLCIGPEHILPIRYSPCSPWSVRYCHDNHYLTTAERSLVIDSARSINQMLGYEINTIDFAFRDGLLYAVDVTNPVPDFDVNRLTPDFFDWVVKRMADYTIRLALEQQPEQPYLHQSGPGKSIHPSLSSQFTGATNGHTRSLHMYSRRRKVVEPEG